MFFDIVKHFTVIAEHLSVVLSWAIYSFNCIVEMFKHLSVTKIASQLHSCGQKLTPIMG